MIRLSFFLLATIFLSCSKKDSPIPVPYDAQVVGRIHTTEIIQEIAKEKLLDFSFDDLFSFPAEDTSTAKKGIENILNNPKDAGIDLLEDVWIYYKNSELGIVARLSDPEDFEVAIRENLTEKIIPSGKLSAFSGERLSAVWNEETAVFFLSENKISEQYLFSIFASDRKLFQAQIPEQESEKEILIWSNNLYLKNFLPEAYKSAIHSDSFSLTSIGFKEGEAEIINQGLLSNKNKYFNSFDINPKLFRENDLLNLGASINLSAISINDPVFNNAFLKQYLDGNIYLRIDSILNQTRIFKTVEMDEEFNTVEKTDTIREHYPSFLFRAGLKNSDSASYLFKYLEQKGLLIEEGNYYKATVSLFPVVATLNHNAFQLSDNIQDGLNSKESHLNTSLSSEKSYLNLLINNTEAFQKTSLNYILPEKIKQVHLTLLPSGPSNIKIAGAIITSEKETYSLLTLAEMLKSNFTQTLFKENQIPF